MKTIETIGMVASDRMTIPIAVAPLFNPEGLWANQGTDILDEDLATARTEMWDKCDRDEPDGSERSEIEADLNEEIANVERDALDLGN